MAIDYSQGYSPENVSALTQQYASTLDPYYNRAGAQIANTLGGQGALAGTPGSNKLQLLQGQKMADIGQYVGGLQTGALNQQYQNPLQVAQLTGTYTNPSTGVGTQTLAGQAQQFGQTQMTPYQQSEVDALNKKQDIENIMSSIGGISGLMALFDKLKGGIGAL